MPTARDDHRSLELHYSLLSLPKTQRHDIDTMSLYQEGLARAVVFADCLDISAWRMIGL